MPIPSAPTGLTVEVFRNKLNIRWVANPDSEKVQGYNIYNSTTSGGGTSGYVKLNNSLIEEVAEVRKETVSSSESSTESSIGTGETRETTITIVDTEEQDIFMYSHTNLTEDRTQYYVVTAINDMGEESAYSIEIQGTPIVITTELVDAPIRSQNDVTLDYITTLLGRQPKLDVKPGSVTRQVHIDPNSYEFYLAYVRIDFGMRSQSFLSLRDLDDSDGDGVSDEVADSEYKQLLKTAYFYDTDQEAQDLIDQAFDNLAFNFGVTRLGATSAQTTVTYYSESAPTQNITVDIDSEISTVPTENESAVRFRTLTSETMDVSDLARYWNSVTERYELSIPVEAVEAGAAGNVNADTIVNSSTAGLSVTNTSAAFGGQDEESNSDLADRALLAIIGLDVGTFYGYKKTVAAIPTVLDEKIVDAGHTLMQRDYDDVRKKHVFGKVDIYIRGGQPIEYSETFGFLYKLVQDDKTFTVSDATQFEILNNNTDVTSAKPILSMKRIYNDVKNQDYDLSGCWMLYKNGTAMKALDISGNLVSTARVTLLIGEILFVDPLEAGDQITADYYYRIAVDDEVPTTSDNINFTLLHEPIRNSYSVYKVTPSATTLLVEGSANDYTIDIATRTITLKVALTTDESLKVDYEYASSQVIAEVVVSSAVAGQTSATLQNTNILESYLIGTDGKTIYINSANNSINASVGMDNTDTFECDYRYREVDEPYLLLQQPVDSITSVQSPSLGTLATSLYELNKIDDILLLGNSTRAERTLEFIPDSADTLIGDSINYIQEDIVLLNEELTELEEVGIAVETIVVRDPDTSTVYTEGRDFAITPEGEGYNVRIARTTVSTIPNDGRTIQVDYEYGEPYTVAYNTNPLVQTVQDAIDESRHLAADVLVKEMLLTNIDFELGVVIKADSDESVVASDIRTAISNTINRLKAGENVAQSDIIGVIELVNNVVSVVVPLTKMVKADGTQVTRERITVDFDQYQSSVVTSWTTGPGALRHNTLGSNAADGFYGIWEDDQPLTLVSTAAEVDTAAGQGFISSAGEVIVSTLTGDSPNLHAITVSYVVNGETGASDIDAQDLNYLGVGDVVINQTEQVSS